MRFIQLLSFALILTLFACASQKSEKPQLVGEISQGTLLTIDENGTKLSFPLKHTDVSAEITGFFAQVSVTQEFENPFDNFHYN